MSDFWGLSDGESAADTGTEYEVPGGGNFDPIPDGSDVLAVIDEAKWDKKKESDFVSLRWSIIGPDEYKNRKVFHKLWVTDDDPTVHDREKAAKKRDKAKRMLSAIDANAGGKLSQQRSAPTDESMMLNLANKPMIIKLRVWEITDDRTGDTINGNWVCAVSPKSHGINIEPEYSKPKSHSAPTSSSYGSGGSALDDDEIPFAPEWRA